MSLPRQLYMVLSPRSLHYAELALESLFSMSAEPFRLHLITDSATDKEALGAALHSLAPFPQHTSTVTAEDELDDAEATQFRGLPHLRAFRHGHPCWRKVTDPLLLSKPGAEMILLDPDLFFPNLFRFEETPSSGLLLMWQRPNCLLPPVCVRAALAAGIPLAHHVDIGVSHWRTGADLQWLDWMLGKLGGGDPLPRLMHVEAIVWAAIAMREGGGYLDPRRWVCWHRTQARRLRRKLGVSGTRILSAEPWAEMKCFHAGGEAKWWMPEYLADQPVTPAEVLQPCAVQPFLPLTRHRYEREQSTKALIGKLGYYRLFGAGAQ